MTFMVIGKNSYIGKNLINFFLKNSIDYIFTSHKQNDGGIFLDLYNPNLDQIDFRKLKIKYAIICAGITKIARCEEEQKYTFVCNAQNILSISNYLLLHNITPIIFSSDYVFDGFKGNYIEDDLANPLNEYGKQKVFLENHLKDKALVLRIGKVYGIEKGDGTIIDEMAFSFASDKKVFAATDQIFNLLYIEDLVEVLMTLLKKSKKGIYNVSAKDIISRFDLAKTIATLLNKENLLQSIELKDLNENFKRPLNTTMNNSKIINEISFNFSNLNVKIEEIVKNYS